MTVVRDNAELLAVGRQLGHLEYTVSDEVLGFFREATEYRQAAFPNLAAGECLEVLFRKCGLLAADRVGHTDRYYSPPLPGRRVQVTGWVRGRHRQRGAERLVVETFAVDEIGTEILRSEHILQVGVGRDPERLGRQPARNQNRSQNRHRADAQPLPALEKRVSEESVTRFEAARRALAGHDSPRPAAPTAGVHAGAALASGMGFAASVAPGELGLAYLHELLDRHFGIDFRQGGRLSVNYRRPIYAGDTLAAQGLAVQESGDGEQVNWRAQVWLENGRGEQVITGEARVTVPSPLT